MFRGVAVEVSSYHQTVIINSSHEGSRWAERTGEIDRKFQVTGLVAEKTVMVRFCSYSVVAGSIASTVN